MTTFAELRAYLTTRPAWEYRLWAGSLAVSFVIIALDALPTSLWGWLIGSILAASCAALAAWGLEMRRERDSARAELDRRDREAPATVAVPLYRPGKGTRLRVVGEQRDGSEYEWPALAREIEHDEWTALMRAVEED